MVVLNFNFGYKNLENRVNSWVNKIRDEYKVTTDYFDPISSRLLYEQARNEFVVYFRENKDELVSRIRQILSLPRTEEDSLGGGNGSTILGLTVPGKYIRLLRNLPLDRKLFVLAHEVAHNINPGLTEEETDQMAWSILPFIMYEMGEYFNNKASKYDVKGKDYSGIKHKKGLWASLVKLRA